MKSRKTMTELELCVLGSIWLRGPCSAYVLRREFAESSSSYWSSSAGSIYPVIERLKRAGLVTLAADPADRRGTRAVAATEKGRRALVAWFADLPGWTGKATLDPIRTRLNFIAVLKSRSDQRRFVERAQENTRAEIASLRSSLGALGQDAGAERLTTLGALYELEGRMKWLKAVRNALSHRRIG